MNIVDSRDTLASASATRAVLDAFGLSAKYRYGQNFLVNDGILKKIVALADVGPADRVLEVGPGIGTLTRELLMQGASVLSVECDGDLIPILAQTTAPWKERFRIVHGDALVFGKDAGPAADAACPQASAPDDAGTLASPPYLPTKLVSNLPYAVAATVVLDYFERFPTLESATVMVQKEVADRMGAKVGSKNYGAYTVKLSLVSRIAGRFAVGPGNFYPAPRVESAVIRLDRRDILQDDGRPAGPALLHATRIMADAAFANRRKTIANSCKSYFASRSHEAPPDLDALFSAAGIDPKRRGETLDVREFIRLGSALETMRRNAS